jgi:hypothetical protein
LVALSLIVMVVVNDPVAAGLNWAWMEQLWPAARLAPQLFEVVNDDAFAPPSVMLFMVSAVPLELLRVTALAAVVVPTVSLPKAMLVADNDAVGPEGAADANERRYAPASTDPL